MVASNFTRALAAVRQDEGGNDDDKQDHGGRTSRGITQREYDAFRSLKDMASADVWQASDAEIDAIYHDSYWEPWGDKFPVGIDYLYFDMAVNAGPHRAVVLLQRALGVADDGQIGVITLAALSKADPASLIASYSTAKKNFYKSLNQPRFTRGWLNRVDHVQSIATSMLTGGN
jgi:lysozyme family protein